MNNNENNTNQVNTNLNNTTNIQPQPVQPAQPVPDTANVTPVSAPTEQVQTTTQPVTPVQQPVVNQAPQQVSSTPQTKVVKVEQVKEVVKEVPVAPVTNQSQTPPSANNGTVPPAQPEVKTEVVVKPKSKIGGIFSSLLLIAFIIFLFAFVYYLPQISQYIEDYKKQKSGVEDGSMKTGTMTCTYTRENNEDITTTYDITFSYVKNKLKKSEQVTSYKLIDSATSTATLEDSNKACQNLKTELVGVSGIDIDCSLTAVLQKTTQTIDYTSFNAKEVETNIAEFKGFYPEYQLDQSIAAIKSNLQDAGYKCINRDADANS